MRILEGGGGSSGECYGGGHKENAIGGGVYYDKPMGVIRRMLFGVIRTIAGTIENHGSIIGSASAVDALLPAELSVCH